MRRRHALLLLSTALVGACGTSTSEPDPTPTLILTGVTVVDGTGAPPRTGQTLHLDEGRIVRIGPDTEVEHPADATVLDLVGRWVIPGLIDTHAHMPPPAQQPRFLRNMLGFGVTTARSTAASPSGGTELRARLRSGTLLGPRFHTAGRLVDAPGSIWGDFGSLVSTEAEMRDEVRAQAMQGVDVVKLYSGLVPELVRAGIEEAHAQGLPVLGHLGRTSWSEAIARGIDGLTHACHWGMASSVVPRADSARFAELYLPKVEGSFEPSLLDDWAAAVDLDAPRFVALAEAMVFGGVDWSPNLVLCEAVYFGDDPAVRGRLLTEYDVAPAELPHPYVAAWSPESRQAARTAFPTVLAVVERLHARGVLLTLGSDTMNPWMTPGASALRELELLVEAGLTPHEALKVGTGNGARALGILDQVGTLEPGKAADLLVLGSDPLADISNVRDLEWVVVGGRAFAPAELRRTR